MPEPLSGPERAAVMIMYLRNDIAKGILQHMDNDEIREIGMVISKVEHVPPSVIVDVVREFVNDLGENSAIPSTGPEFVNRVLPTLLDESRRDEIMLPLQRRVDRSFEEFITSRPPQAVAALLREEPSQAQAVALSLMGTSNAARVLRYMSEDDRREAVIRMSKLKHIPGEMVDDVIHGIRDGLGPMWTPDPINGPGVTDTARILVFMNSKQRESLLDDVEDVDPDLRDELERSMLQFSDLRAVSGRHLQVLLKNVERADLIIALKYAEEDMREYILSNVSKRAAEDYREEMTILDPVSKSRQSQSFEAITASANKLRESGDIYLPLGSEAEED
ncbi:MAG: flagellar motor switch protein FliG [Myxococcota bacterium]|jgi:flagellar motor switch protein FliG